MRFRRGQRWNCPNERLAERETYKDGVESEGRERNATPDVIGIRNYTEGRRGCTWKIAPAELGGNAGRDPGLL